MTDSAGRAPAAGAVHRHATPTGVQRLTDAVAGRLFLWAIPRSVRPNHLTALRFILIPVVLTLFQMGATWQALVVFVVAAMTDFLDGAMARSRDQITDLGIITDPIADKLLIGSVLFSTGWDYLVIKVIVISIVLELLLASLGAFYYKRTGIAVPANVFGKVKMVLLSAGVFLFLVGRLMERETVTEVAVVILWVALGFALLSPLKYLALRQGGA